MICYKDTTFCSAKCNTISCHRNRKGSYYGDGPQEYWLPVAISDFSKPDMNGNTCTHYQPEKNEDNK